MQGKLLLGALLLGAIAAPGHAQSRSQYRVDANSTLPVNLNICSARARLTVDGDNDTDLDFRIIDSSGRTVHSDTDSTDLTYATLSNGGSGCAPYTLYVQNLGRVYNNFSVTIADGGAPVANRGGQSGDGRDRRVSVHNHTSEDFLEIRFSNTSTTSWGPDRIPDIMRAHTNRVINVDDGTGACQMDIRVKTVGGRTYEKRDINVCAVSSVEFGSDISH